jgi:hypothetical protein
MSDHMRLLVIFIATLCVASSVVAARLLAMA